MKNRSSIIVAIIIIGYALSGISVSAIPLMLSYQGMVQSEGESFTGEGLFQFALINDGGSVFYWSNDGKTPPLDSIQLTVMDGLFQVNLGDTALMNAIPASAFNSDTLYLRVWFSPMGEIPEVLTPDQRVISCGFAVRAESADKLAGVQASSYATRTWSTGEYVDIAGDTMTGALIVPDDGFQVGTKQIVAADGKTGIGTADPQSALHVVGDTEAGDVIIAPDYASSGKNSSLFFAEDRSGNYGMGLQYHGEDNVLSLYGKSSSTIYGPHLFISRNEGNVGLGVSDPQSRLHINGDIRIPSSGGQILNETGNYLFQTWWRSDFGDYTAMNSGYTWESADEPISVVAGSQGFFITKGDGSNTPYAVKLMRIKTDGSVGIGTTTPSAKLEVQGGAIKATGGFIIETRTSDPASPVTGQMWLRTDL